MSKTKNNPEEELFDKNISSPGIDMSHKPLAERMRPSGLENFYGQSHLVGEGKPIRKMIEKNDPVSMILWGPPGVGKTTLALIISKGISAEFIELSAVSSGVKDIRDAIETGKNNLKYYRKRTILFIDEIHRFNKAQQDSLLHSVEKGTVILIGATTENPECTYSKNYVSLILKRLFQTLLLPMRF